MYCASAYQDVMVYFQEGHVYPKMRNIASEKVQIDKLYLEGLFCKLLDIT